MCSKNYAEWRASWSDAWKFKRFSKLLSNLLYDSSNPRHQYLKDVPVKITCRKGDIEFINESRRFPHVSTINIKGDIKVWDCSLDIPELTHSIDRNILDQDCNLIDVANKELKSAVQSKIDRNVWCSDQEDELLVVGCEGGRFETWNTISGQLQYCDKSNKSSINLIRISNHKLVVTRLDGLLQVYQLPRIQNRLKPIFMNSNAEFRQCASKGNELLPKLLYSTFAHGQPISAIEIQSSHIITGGMDHIVKVYRFDSDRSLYSFREHLGNISEIKADRYSTSEVISGCQLGIGETKKKS